MAWTASVVTQPSPGRHPQRGTPARQPVRRVRRRPAARALAWLVAGLAAGGVGLAYGYLWLQASQVEAGYQLVVWQQRLAQEQAAVDQLRRQQLELGSPARVEAVARGQLGMVDEPQLQLVLPDAEPTSPPRTNLLP
ncbi:MAG: hypothetical protein IMX01_03195 [Limnochordaceae bacterium]|nr:hypothetical protein [Limnochordaceae bacterium]